MVIEFVSLQATSIAPFEAEVEFFAQEASERMVADLFEKWYKSYQASMEESDNACEDDTDAATATECFQQLFGNHKECSTQEATAEFLATAISPMDSQILNKLLKWTKDIYQMFLRDGNTLTLGSDTTNGLVEEFLPFTRKMPFASFKGKDLHFTPWPFVSIVRVRLQSLILSQGIILADLPGVSDINRFPVDAANRYMQSCNITMVVTRIDRAESSIHFKEQYMAAFRRRRTGSVIMAITRSDDINLVGRSNITFEHQDRENLDSIDQKIAELEKKLQVSPASFGGSKKKLREKQKRTSREIKALEQE